MVRVLMILLAGVLFNPALGYPQASSATQSVESFKVGTFLFGTTPSVGIVVIGAGTSGGVGMGTSVRGQQVWLVAGDEITATIDGIGTLRHKVEAAPAPPSGTGSYLPPVSSYRQGRGRAGGAGPAK